MLDTQSPTGIDSGTYSSLYQLGIFCGLPRGGTKVNVAVLSDSGKGDINKIEKLNREQILKAGQFFTAADFAGQAEADAEDLFDPEIFAQLLGVAYAVPRSHEAAVEKRRAADPATPRIAKQAEALFKLMPLEVPEFGHYRAAEWLIRNPRFLDASRSPLR